MEWKGDQIVEAEATHRSAITVGVLSDHPVVRAGLCSIVGSWGMDVLIAGPFGADVAVKLQGVRCRVALVEVTATSLAGCLLLCQQFREQPSAPVVVAVDCTGHPPAQLRQLVEGGLREYVSVAHASEPLRAAILAVSRGEIMLHSPRDYLIEYPGGSTIEAILGLDLADIDIEMLQRLGTGMKDPEVAKALAYAASTVKHRMEHLTQRINLRTRFQLGGWAVAHHAIEPPGSSGEATSI